MKSIWSVAISNRSSTGGMTMWFTSGGPEVVDPRLRIVFSLLFTFFLLPDLVKAQLHGTVTPARVLISFPRMAASLDVLSLPRNPRCTGH